MKNILYKIFQLINIALTAYVGLWLMFIKPIFDCCTAIDMGTFDWRISCNKYCKVSICWFSRYSNLYDWSNDNYGNFEGILNIRLKKLSRILKILIQILF